MATEATNVSRYALFKEQVEQAIVDTQENNVIYPEIVNMINNVRGNSYSYNSTDSDFTLEELGPNSDIASDALEFTRNVVNFKELGLSPLIPKRLVEDEDWDEISLISTKLGKAGARIQNTDTIDKYDEKCPTANKVAGTAWSTTSTDIIKNVSDAILTMEANNYMENSQDSAPTGRMVLNSAQYAAARVNDDFRKATVMGENVQREGKVPTVLGLGILKTNARSAGTATLVDIEFPMSFYMRKPFSVSIMEPDSRRFKVESTIRYGLTHKIPNATAQIYSIS